MELYKYCVPLIGIFAAWAVVGILPLQGPTFFRILQWFGAYTLDIYVSHQYLLRFGVGTGAVHVITTFAIALAGSLAISLLILRRNEVMAHIFLGKPYAKRDAKTEAAKSSSAALPVPSSQPAQ